MHRRKGAALEAKTASYPGDEALTARGDARRNAWCGLPATLLLVFACFTLTSEAYIAWLYHLASIAPAGAADMLTMVCGYACQAVGLGIAAIAVRTRPNAMSPLAFVLALSLHFACAVPAACSASLAASVVFGLIMNTVCGAIAAFYLMRIAQCVSARSRGKVFGVGYACSVLVSWLLSLLPQSALTQLPVSLAACAAFSLAAAILAYSQAKAGLPDCGDDEDECRSRDKTEGGFRASPETLAVACIAVLLLSLVKNTGFSFPSADLSGMVSLEMSRLFYAAGLVAAGVVIDRSRKYGALCCLAALVTPFVCMSVASEPVPSVVMWVVDYFFYGFFSVFRVVLLCDLASGNGKLYLAGFGLMFGRIGDALGTGVNLSLGSNAVALVVVAAMLFVAAVFAFYRLFQALFSTQAAPQRSEEDMFQQFAAEFNLSAREREVLRLVLEERTNVEIASQLFVSESTVKFHVRNLLKKTDCKNRVELMDRYAARRS